MASDRRRSKKELRLKGPLHTRSYSAYGLYPNYVERYLRRKATGFGSRGGRGWRGLRRESFACCIAEARRGQMCTYVCRYSVLREVHAAPPRRRRWLAYPLPHSE